MVYAPQRVVMLNEVKHLAGCSPQRVVMLNAGSIPHRMISEIVANATRFFPTVRMTLLNNEKATRFIEAHCHAERRFAPSPQSSEYTTIAMRFFPTVRMTVSSHEKQHTTIDTIVMLNEVKHLAGPQ